ncbi:MAG: hypothetical protein ACRERD_04945 [Candidatus Binatia bacterium]
MDVRRLLVVLLILTGGFLGSCGDSADDIFSFGVDVNIDRQTVPGFAEPLVNNCDFATDLILNPAALTGLTIRFSEEEELQGRDIIDVDKVTVDRVVLEIVDEAPGGDQDTFDFIDSLRLFADDPNDNQPEVLVLVLDPVPTGQKRIVVRGTGVDITEIATRDTFILRGEASGRPPCDDVNFVGEVEFDVELF